MNMTFWIAFGLAAGIIANILNPRLARGGILGPIVLGILGTVVGGTIGTIILSSSTSTIQNFTTIIAIGGCLAMLTIQRMLRNV